MNNKILITPRLKAVADMITQPRVADIGTDHGKLLIYLADSNRLNFGIGSDVNKGPAKCCEQNVLKYGYQNIIKTRIGDGLNTISKNEVGTVVIAGMGGELILKILEDNLKIANSVHEIILQPMTNIPKLIDGLDDINFKIFDAKLAKEKDKLYQIFCIKKGKNNYKKQIDYVISPAYKNNNDPLLTELLDKEIYKAKEKIRGLKKAEILDKEELKSAEKLLKELENYEN